MHKKTLLETLLVGGGGRECAIAWKLRQSPRLGKLYVAPGNAGTAQIAENVPISATDIEGLLKFALRKGIDLTIVGQDDPLALAIVDVFQANRLKIFGPTRDAARIESSKAFSKRFMAKYGIPTSRFEVFTKHERALEHVRRHFGSSNLGKVIKASGLALGKGVYPCGDFDEAASSLRKIMLLRTHGIAGDEVVIENFVDGPEVSMHAISDGKTHKLFPSARDHKRLLDGDKGPNTGGMGTIAPVPKFSLYYTVHKDVIAPALFGLKEEGAPFTGVLYPGLKMPKAGLTVLEFNARFGDPEAQVYMRLLETDLLDILEACVEGRLKELDIEWHRGYAACVVMASEGYPDPDHKRGLTITGIDKAESLPGVVVFHAGTKEVDGNLITSGGRVLGVSAIGDTLREAIDRAYQGVECIHFKGAHYRKDIGAASF
ncbi:MAG: phosphoribosylamine--glycine ligase [Candidatus Taylorbacteria bacterium RIFCSPLOWO2_12_FULL_43_20]|uniref:Phosphoribosylamine--glycine ligase n=1 Tax=Candidatus Taylorbacteria bacterium RIFCSPLOWO2_12_FULL_43_20 TaxID=1802332 RepID=A0A1G2P5A5_9BACT|nr:MAG: phosphoribosylamine--glycine ligase [Candidatus Taylorbacteria bacterium RIFCSPHIGHO2_01_FULL_43_120]OHA22094.1 MAG: phosphoribosylamine--glycine ligase [Candidatus Taylorbacteria bacterium RIFCSPHIGHO2_02_FULL_43_55]OHA28187.1 MAG: phosphoribosylamine--glycine ligase [Candidatus Taylorbacteria bacterium RIFCSPHIGHO2_12_FULL_42_34]OHA31065.1 MAG: phosphoribosylamine--glycine ligase [Candidatus Taylorbacteria bacterium RIFCSPLOWO2_01_FULL_43_83]OHA39770.1 MAG: phosphoribosylamine--glycin